MGGNLSGIALKDLLEAGVHFGHQTKRWNPKMKQYIFGERNGIYIIDLAKTAKLFREAEEFVHNLAAEGKTILFVGTKRQAQDAVAEEAQRAGMYFVNHPLVFQWRTNLKRAGLRHYVVESQIVTSPTLPSFD